MNIIKILKKQGGLKLLKQYLKGGAFFTAVGEILLLGNSKTALEILRNAASLKIKQNIEKKYRKTILEIEKSYNKELEIEYPRKVWFCWFQGLDNAPEIVKICFASLKKNITDREIVVLTKENYQEYVSFPVEIQNKIDTGVIQGAHMSDLLRLELLQNYGGTWIDATVFCGSEDIPDYMLNSDFFLFQCLKPGKDGQATVISNWFITAKPNQKYIYMMRELMYDYWKNNTEVIDYFIFHDFFQIIIDNNLEEWSKIIPFSNSTPHILLLRLFEEYDEKLWNAVIKMSPFHKLSYKFEDTKTTIQNTYYQQIRSLYEKE
ncbi:capsular polysaccharide synthesis protein [Enterococcus cecorum]|uniref:capsular polysaccharide synthesis protein n=1 Tax=Enterococcus cecorum TaxID=44008 RepID=UPI0032C40A01